MAEFPDSPISPSEFLESFIPEAYAEAGLPEAMADLDLQLGVQLEGEGGGQWLLHFSGGLLVVEAGSREGAIATLVQSVDDWRGALWEERGGSFGRGATALFRPVASDQAKEFTPPTPSTLEHLRTLNGSLKLVVAGGEAGEWSLTVMLGPGEIPAQPTTTITVSEADSEALERGELDPMQAFMSGRIQIGGDMSLLMQLQAASM